VAFGRDAEIAVLHRALDAARDGRRQVVFVTGEAGIGKTTLVEAFLDRAARGGDLRVAQGRCIEQYGTGEAYLPVLEALEGLARQVGNDALRAVLLRYAPAWLAQLPWLAHDADPAALQRALAGTTAQRMLREIAHALEVLSAERTIVLWLEDLHWSDYSTLDVITMLAGRRDRARLLVIASFRPADAQGRESPLSGLAQGLQQRGQALGIPLGLLDPQAIAAYLRARLAGAASGLPIGEMASVIHARTGGNSLFTVAIVDSWIRDAKLAQLGDGWVLNVGVAELGTGLPDNLRQLVLAQIGRLPEEDRRVIESAAVAGADFCAAAVAAALQCSVADAEERCLRLANSGRFLRARGSSLWPDGTESGGFQFVHALYWHGAYEHAAHARRAEWQRRIAEREEEAYGTQRAMIAAELAMRFEVARDFDRAVRYLELAGAGALSRCAYKECADLLRRALSLIERLPADTQARRRLGVLLPLGAALMAIQGYASDEVESTYRRGPGALPRCRKAGPGRARAAWPVECRPGARRSRAGARPRRRDDAAHGGRRRGGRHLRRAGQERPDQHASRRIRRRARAAGERAGATADRRRRGAPARGAARRRLSRLDPLVYGPSATGAAARRRGDGARTCRRQRAHLGLRARIRRLAARLLRPDGRGARPRPSADAARDRS
jgi:predicted ATPase